MTIISLKYIGKDEVEKHESFKGKKFDSVEEAAEAMGISVKTVYKMLKDGRMTQKRKETLAVKTWDEIISLKSEVRKLRKIIESLCKIDDKESGKSRSESPDKGEQGEGEEDK